MKTTNQCIASEHYLSYHLLTYYKGIKIALSKRLADLFLKTWENYWNLFVKPETRFCNRSAFLRLQPLNESLDL